MPAYTFTVPDEATGVRVSPISGDTFFNLTTAMDAINQGFKVTRNHTFWLGKHVKTAYVFTSGSFAYQFISPSTK